MFLNGSDDKSGQKGREQGSVRRARTVFCHVDMKNKKMSSAITATVLLVNLICIVLLYLVASTTMTSMMNKSAMEDLHASLSVQAEIVKEYIRHQEDLLSTYSDSDIVRDFLKNPDNPEKQAAAQAYTERYYSRLSNWEGLYIGEWNTHIIAHSNPATVGMVTREGAPLLQLQNAMESRNGLYNAGIIVSPATGKLILSLYCPVFDTDGSTIIGYVGGGPLAEGLETFMASAKNDAATYYMINVASRKYIFAQDEELMATDIQDKILLNIIRIIEQNTNAYFGDESYVDERTGASIMAYQYIPEYGWAVVSCNSEVNIYDDVNKNMIVLAAICAVFEVLIGVLSWFCIRYSTRPMKHIRDAITQLQDMKLEKNSELDQYINTTSEVGQIATAIDSLYDSIKDMLQTETEKQAVIASNESKARFLASMSYEIRTPINTIIGMNEMILRENQDGIIQEYAINIKRESQLLIGLVNDVLDFSKIEAGKLKIVEKAYETSYMLYDTVISMMPRIRDKQLELVREIDAGLPKWLKGDEIRIRQVLNNLLSNAVKYTEKGKITFRASGELKEEQYWLKLEVEDTGIGIKEEDLVQVFESFKRLELDKTHYIEGSGLGLNITKQLVELMGGTITVASEYGKGSCFTVYLPQQPTTEDDTEVITAEKVSGKEQCPYLQLPDARILAVDDNKMNLTVLTALLKRSQMQVDTATSGMAGVELTEKTKYDLILMDHMMPGMDGIEALHAIREESTNPNRNTPVIVLTANAIAGMEEKYLAEGFEAYMTKPVSVEKLEYVLREYLMK